jgi:hypothetical protein
MAYKYYVKTDKRKETVGTVRAPSLEVAYENAAKVKQLPLKDFVKIFEVEKLKRHGK